MAAPTCASRAPSSLAIRCSMDTVTTYPPLLVAAPRRSPGLAPPLRPAF
jgi:hypothetical protein